MYLLFVRLSVTWFCVSQWSWPGVWSFMKVTTLLSRVVSVAIPCDDFCVWTYQLLSLSCPSVSCIRFYWQGVCVEGTHRSSSVSLMCHTDPELSLYLWVPWWTLCPSVTHKHLSMLILWVTPYTSMVTKQTVNAREADVVTQHAVGWLGRSDTLWILFLSWICPAPHLGLLNSAAGLIFEAF